MASKWWGREEPEVKPQEEIEVKAPKEITEKLSKIDGLESSVSEIKNKFSILDKMGSFLEEQEQAKAAARAAKAQELATKATIELSDKWIEDPQKAFEDASAPLKLATINAHSLIVRREVFDDGKEFEFYHGDFKQKVDKYIDTLPPQSKADPQAIKNCYYLVLGQSQSDIREGKLKSKFAATSTSGKSSEGPEGTKKEIQLTDEQKRAADRLGVPHEKYAANIGDLSYV